jgi:glycosyltransferase involved in cell wall biosynthesis
MEFAHKICLLTLYPPTKHGIADYAQRFTRSLSLQLPENLRIVVLADKEQISNVEKHDNQKVVVRRIWRRGLLSCFTMLNAVLREKPDAIHVQFTYTYIWGRMSLSALFPFTLLLFRVLRKPILVTIHDVIDILSLNKETIEIYGTNIPSVIAKLGFLTVTKLIAAFSRKVIVHSSVSEKVLVRNYGIDSMKVAVIKHGTPPLDSNYRDSEEAKKVLNLQGKHIALFFGFLASNKGIEWLIRSFSDVASKDREAVLLIAGGNHPRLNYDYVAKLRELTSMLGLEKKVTFLGYVNKDMVPLVFKAADVVVLPYLVGGSSSGVLKIAFSYLKPTVASNLPTFQEEIINNVTGMLVPPNNTDKLSETLLTLLSDEGLRKKFSEGIRERSNCSSWQSVTKETLNLYVSVMSGTTH